MIEEIDERIDCRILFQRGKVTPLSIFWEKKWFNIEKVLLHWEERKGRQLLRHFSVTDSCNTFHIVFYPDSLTWKLKGVDKGD